MELAPTRELDRLHFVKLSSFEDFPWIVKSKSRVSPSHPAVRASKSLPKIIHQMHTYKKMTRETVEVCSDKKKPREEIENIKEIEDVE